MARRSSVATQHAAAHSAGRRTTRRTAKGSKEVVRPLGRPTALTDRVEETILGLFMEGCPVDTACALAGINPATFYRWMQRGEDARETLDATGSLPPEEERFRDFRESVLDARAQAERRMVGIVWQAASGGNLVSEEPVLDLSGNPVFDENGKAMYRRSYSTPDGRLAMQYLQRARPNNWSQQAANINAKVEVSGPGGGPVEVEHTVEQVVNLSERLMAVRQQFEAEERELAEGDGDVVDGEVVEER